MNVQESIQKRFTEDIVRKFIILCILSSIFGIISGTINGIKDKQINKIENNVIEQHLKKSFEDISLVSVIKKGTNLIVNVKEKELVEQNYSPICAPNNLLIERIEVSQGIQKVKEGEDAVAPNPPYVDFNIEVDEKTKY